MKQSRIHIEGHGTFEFIGPEDVDATGELLNEVAKEVDPETADWIRRGLMAAREKERDQLRKTDGV